jgi:hypothetical protein
MSIYVRRDGTENQTLSGVPRGTRQAPSSAWVVGSGGSVALAVGGVSSPAVTLAQFVELIEERGLAVLGEAFREFIEAGE